MNIYRVIHIQQTPHIYLDIRKGGNDYFPNRLSIPGPCMPSPTVSHSPHSR